MKIGLAIRRVRSTEARLARELQRVGERHKTDHEVYHLTRTLANMSRHHIDELSRFEGRYPVLSGADGGRGLLGSLRSRGTRLLGVVRKEGASLLEPARERGAELLEPVREKGSELVGRQPQSGLLLLRDLSRLSGLISEVSMHWVILGQGAQVARDHELLGTVKECHTENLRQMKWANTLIKQISPQVLMS